MNERRNFTRFKTIGQGYAVFRQNFSKVGKINDISTEGLSFNYLAKDIQEEEFSHVDIFMVGSGFHLTRIPCTIIYDEKVTIFGCNDICGYRCGIKFGPLETKQQHQLQFFLKVHTTPPILRKNENLKPNFPKDCEINFTM